MIWLLYYVLACWCIAAAIVICLWKWGPFAELVAATPSVRLLAIVPVYVLSSPLWMPYLFNCCLQCGWEIVASILQIWRAHRFRKSYHEYVFRPAEYFELAQEVRDWWDAIAPQYFQLGFSLVGDYRLREEPYLMHDRCCWHDSGTVFASASAITLTELSEMNFDMLSWLEDGSNVCTVTVEGNSRGAEPNIVDDKLHITYASGASAEELFARHRQEVANAARTRGLAVLAFDADHHQQLIIHNQRTFYTWALASSRVPIPQAGLPAARERLTPDEFLAATEVGSKMELAVATRE